MLGRVDNSVSHGNIWIEYMTDLDEWEYKEKNKIVRLKEFLNVEEVLNYLNKN